MEEERIINPELENKQEERLEKSLRPSTLEEYIGQDKIKENMKIYIESAKKRGEPLDHCLLYGPPGLRKDNIIKYHSKRNACKYQNHFWSSNRKTRGVSSITYRLIRI